MCITYPVGDGLYVNVTNRCSNACDFCIRNNGDGAYGSDSLWLEREPTEEEILDSVFSRDLDAYREIVFCGYGEPGIRLDTCVSVAKEIKRRRPGTKIRINTNGQTDLIFGKRTAPLYEGAFDSVSISLNAPTAEGYQNICHSRFGAPVFDAILRFAADVKNFVSDTVFSVVDEFISKEDLALCYKISEQIGVRLKVREYISAEDNKKD